MAKTATAMAAAFEKVGIDKAGMTLHAQVVTFAKTGGSEERAIQIVRQAFASMAGQRLNATRQSVGDEAGHGESADSHARRALPSSSDRAGGGQHAFAKDGLVKVAPTVREPTEGQRKAMAKAMAKTAEVINITILDTYKLLDGRLLKDVRIGELESIRNLSSRQAAVIRHIERIGVADQNALVGDVINAEQLNRMLQRAAEVADAG